MKKKFELDQVPYALAKEIFKRVRASFPLGPSLDEYHFTVPDEEDDKNNGRLHSSREEQLHKGHSQHPPEYHPDQCSYAVNGQF